MARAAIALPDAPPAAPPAILTATVSGLPTSPERSICRIDSTTPQSRHRAWFRRLIVSRAPAGRACGPSACAFSKPPAATPCLDDARSSGILAYEAGIARTIATIPDAANTQMETPAIHIGPRAGRLNGIRISIPFVVRWYERSLASSPAIHRNCERYRPAPDANLAWSEVGAKRQRSRCAGAHSTRCGVSAATVIQRGSPTTYSSVAPAFAMICCQRPHRMAGPSKA
jgi:hypothetical protein